MLLELVRELGLNPTKNSSTQGGELHSPCPHCGGKDRFYIQPLKKMKNCVGYYRCRQCQISGDTIQFLMDFRGMTFSEACKLVGHLPAGNFDYDPFYRKSDSAALPTIIPSLEWQKKALDVVTSCHKQLMNTPSALCSLEERGLTLETIKKYQIGWNGINRYDAPNLWGIMEPGAKDRWLPRGIVIPSFFEGKVMKLKIRRDALPPGDNRKYIIVSGGRNSPSFFGDPNLPIVVQESELDAILLQQFCEDLCCCMAVPAGNKVDIWADQILKSTPQLIFSMDFDEAGKNSFSFWKTAYPNIRAWPISRGKSPGDAYKLGVDLRQWLIGGLT